VWHEKRRTRVRCGTWVFLKSRPGLFMEPFFLFFSSTIARLRLCSTGLCVCAQLTLLMCLATPLSVAQEVSFTPRYDGVSPGATRAKRTPTATPEAAQAPKLYSLSRFNVLFQQMCELLEADQRRDRVFEIAKSGVEEEQGCSSCRALLRQLVQSCAPKPSTKKTPPSDTPTPRGDRGDAAPDATGEENLPTEAPMGISPRRYPRTDLVEVLSRLSSGLYEFSPGKGPVFEALKNLERRLMVGATLTPGERDYFGTVMAYLFSAWAGRPDSPLENPTPSPEEIAELFQ
jgi:hypothetical protein